MRHIKAFCIAFFFALLASGAIAQTGNPCRNWGVNFFTFHTQSSHVEDCLILGKDPNVVNPKNGDTLLHDAASWDSPASILFLNHARKMPIDTRNHAGNSALHVAAYMDHPAVVDLLLDLGADPNAKNKMGQNTIHVAANFQGPRFVGINARVSHDMDDKVYHRGKDHIASLTSLVKAGGDINARDANGDAPIHIAAKNQWDNPEIIYALAELGADLNMLNEDGYSPLHLAIMVAEPDPYIIRSLVNWGANPLMETSDGMIPIEMILMRKGGILEPLNKEIGDIVHNASMSWLGLKGE